MCEAPLEMNEGTQSGKSTICLKGSSAVRPTNGLYLFFTACLNINKSIRLFCDAILVCFIIVYNYLGAWGSVVVKAMRY